MKARVSLYRVSASIEWSNRQSSRHREATGLVRSEYATNQGAYSSMLYPDRWTADLRSACVSARRIVADNTSNGLVTREGLDRIVGLWNKAASKIEDRLSAVHADWDSVINYAKSELGELFDPYKYPTAPYSVKARLKVSQASWPTELDDSTVASLRTQSEASLREEIAEAQQRQIEEIVALVEKVNLANASKKDGRKGKTIKAAIKRLNTLRKMNIMNDPAYDARIVSALSSIGASVPDAPIFTNPWTEEQPNA